jgi:exo-1,4-beta-D-glucosaminidase
VVTWQYVDWYLRPTSAYYGAKKACEPLHIQYAYDDECVWVINSYRKGFSSLKVSAEVFNLEGKTLWAYSKDGVAVEPDGKTNVFKVELTDEVKKPMYFLRLSLTDNEGKTISTNTYWLSPTIDIPRDSGVNLKGEFYVKYKSYFDFNALNNLSDTRLKVEAKEITESAESKDRIFAVNIKNVGDAIAFMVIPEAYPSDKIGYELPRVFWSEGGLILKPGEEVNLLAKIPRDAISGAITPVFGARGWNIKL